MWKDKGTEVCYIFQKWNIWKQKPAGLAPDHKTITSNSELSSEFSDKNHLVLRWKSHAFLTESKKMHFINVANFNHDHHLCEKYLYYQIWYFSGMKYLITKYIKHCTHS